jgi:endogenous inhibitor of DNA gyrase (YacG/DUF329 family)
MAPESSIKKIKCPTCGQPTEYSSANRFRPFCSERCQLIDLGEWAEGRYAIPVADASKNEEKTSDASRLANQDE